MKAIWTQDEASYHGEHVNFERIWSWPRPPAVDPLDGARAGRTRAWALGGRDRRASRRV